jgi:hypothetical protein
MAYADASWSQRRFGETTRSDAWWVQPAAVFIGLSIFIVYSTWAAFHPLYHGNPCYWYGVNGANYLSPFFSPEIFGISPDSWFGHAPGWWPSWLPAFSPAFLILWAPAGFRLTCYYYRGAYYKAFWADPPACAVGEPRKAYLGERSFPLILQNVHRYFLYLGLLFLVNLAYDVWAGLWFKDAGGVEHFGIGVGTVVLALNVFFLSSYTLGCHSLRHLIGGFLDEPSQTPVCAKGYACVSCLNRSHMMWAWISLFWVGFADLYVRLCAMGIWHDFHIIF